MKYVLLMFIIFFAISGFAKSSKSNNLSLQRQSIYEVEFSDEDEQVGRLLIELISDLSKGKIRAKKLTSITKYQKNDIYQIIKDEINTLKQLTQKKLEAKQVVFICTNANDMKKRFLLKEKIDQICKSIFLNKLLKEKKHNLITSENLNYFKESLPYFFKRRRLKKKLASLIKQTKKHQPVHKVISYNIYKKALQNKLKLPSSLAQSLLLTEEMRGKLSQIGLENSQVSMYFTNEFQKKADKIASILKNNEIELANNKMHNLIQFYNGHKNLISEEVAWSKLTNLAKKFLLTYGQTQTALDLYSLALSIVPLAKYEESIYLTLWANIYAKRYKDNIKLINRRGLLANFDRYDNRLKFWIAYSYEKEGGVSQANKLYKKIVRGSYFSYYSVLSIEKLLGQKVVNHSSKVVKDLLKPTEEKIIYVNECEKTTLKTFTRLHLWARLSYGHFIRKEVRRLFAHKDDILYQAKKAKSIDDYEKILITNITNVLNLRDQYLNTFKILDRSITDGSYEMSYNVLKRLFPTDYMKHIENHNSGLDPILVLSLIRQESAFNPRARSSVGARGLMQLMPSTARMLKRNIRKKKLLNPKINIEIGIKYLNKLVRKYDGNLIYALAAYNAGETALRRWRKNYLHSDDPLVNVEAIPYKETRTYVKLIYRNIFFYKFLNDQLDTKKAIPQNFYVSLGKGERSAH